ncbi:sigma-70 family RNA polymerase sigma factor [Actinoplanes sp. NPDC049548]|uniref:RNA polymerase sigma factor n=1 Tax=Actinoplanes sp. NPDC049548 TaxID=3155152 RepID=UPI00344ADBC4
MTVTVAPSQPDVSSGTTSSRDRGRRPLRQQDPQQIAALVRRAADGDPGAWDALVARHSRLLWSVARGFRLGPEQAADVVQTTWLRLVEHISRIRDPERITAWLLRTARNLAVDVVQSAGRELPLVSDQHRADAHEEPERSALRGERERIVRQAIGRLPQRDRRLLSLLADSARPDYARISRILGMPVGSIGPTRARALRRLRTELEAEGLRDAAPI